MAEASVDWLLLAYTLPAEPSRKRVSVWRRLRKIGAVHMQEGFWYLPHTPALADQIAGVVKEVETLDGSAVAFVAHNISSDQSDRLRQRFLQARTEEYNEILHEVNNLLGHINRERDRGHFTFLEVEELEEDLDKCARWLEDVRSRDLLGSSGYDATHKVLDECREAILSFTEDVYRHSGGEGAS